MAPSRPVIEPAPGGADPAAPGEETREPSLADLCFDDPLDLDRDPRLRSAPAAPAQPCGALCTPWCLGGHS